MLLGPEGPGHAVLVLLGREQGAALFELLFVILNALLGHRLGDH